MSRLELVGSTDQYMLNNAAVSAAGRVFTSFPRWLGQPTPGVGEVAPDGSIQPYPGDLWNSLNPAQSAPEDRFECVHSIHIDRLDRLWVVDEGKSFFDTSNQSGSRPKLVCFDLQENRAQRVYVLNEIAAPEGTQLGHLRANETHAFITDAHLGAIIVLDLHTGHARRVLDGHALTAADPTIVPIVDGKPLLARGKPLVVQVDLVELSRVHGFLYFSALFGPTLYRVPVEVITDAKLSDDEIAEQVEKVARIPPVSGIMEGHDGLLYLSSLTDRSILRLRPDSATPELFLREDILDSPNEGSISVDNYLYVPASQANLLPAFHDGQSRLSPPYCIYRTLLS
ncbi:major royal jelly protein [Rhizobium sp. SJZ105]|uniref:L-dopachrome tautomerase-related protein n=1 Tax=Rhizobium sp. SJZ105 TaxID=2572678 RepID=UPI0011A9E9F8|nr:L-dopachrome tautomerase-related protein [Rhizobium sp. SJZ105]TWC76370.1 major royal jelly protein [Rhizobium sp. SJZ105]